MPSAAARACNPAVCVVGLYDFLDYVGDRPLYPQACGRRRVARGGRIRRQPGRAPHPFAHGGHRLASGVST